MKIPSVFRIRKISLRMLLAILPLILAWSLIISIFGASIFKSLFLVAAEDKATAISQMIAYNLGAAVHFEDGNTIREVVDTARQNKELTYISVTDMNGKILHTFKRGGDPESGRLALDKETKSSPKMIHSSVPVTYDGRNIAALHLGLSLNYVFQLIQNIKRFLFFISIVLFILSAISLFLLGLLITKPLRLVSDTVKLISKGDMTKRAPVRTADEVGQLAASFNSMVDALEESRRMLESRVEERTHKLASEMEERKRAEAALRESEQKFRNMVEDLGEGVALLTPDEDFVFVNKKSEIIFGVPPGGLIGKNLRDFTSPEAFALILEQTHRRRFGEKGQYEIKTLRPDGISRNVLVSSIPLLGTGGGYEGSLTVFSDITEKKSVEVELEKANRQLTVYVQELEQRNAEIMILSELYDGCQVCVTLEEIYEVTCRFAAKLFPGDAGDLYIYKESRNLLDSVNSWGDESPSETNVILPDDCWGLRKGKAYIVKDPSSELICPHVKEKHDKYIAYICVPLAARGTILGLLHIRFKEKGVLQEERLGRLKLGLAQSIGERVALAIDNLKLRDQLRMQSIRDPLTGLYNRRFMEESIEREWARAMRMGTHLGVIMMDIDKFKNFNDSFGHEAGDIMLKAVGAFLQNQVRKEDIVCRYGGEEFIVILPGATLEATKARALRLCEDMRLLRVDYEGGQLEPVTMSLGIASYPDQGAFSADVIKAADLALLKAKKEGRNRVVVAS